RILGLRSNRLETIFSIELADEKKIESREVVKGCILNLCNHEFLIDFLPVPLGSFDIVVGMDWLTAHRADVLCFEKVVRIPLHYGEILHVQGEESGAPLCIITCMKAQKCLRKGHIAFLINVIDSKLKSPKLEDIPIVREFPGVFPEDLPGIPPLRQVEFRIDLVPGAVPIARSPYRLGTI
ncbi:MAG: hypothetical protein Q8755_02700, partial [Candidatus Phytoplasma australasiaticum]|nr:hypothetical protein [Candidatus Phytoplasma australasiaticum]